MHTIKVELQNRSYDIIINRDISGLGKALGRLDIGRDAYVITNSFILRRIGKALSSELIRQGFSVKFKTVADSEKSKSLQVAGAVIEDIARFDKKRKIFIIAFGGGVVGDLTGFVASIYKRGIPYVHIPTTLLAQVDSSIGGKTAVDLPQGKNLAGAFYQPKMVFSSVDFLASLDKRQMACGLAEVIKYALIGDKRLLAYLEANIGKIANRDPVCLEFIVRRCAKIKAGIVKEDEFDKKGIRMVLNFGHTVGHAIEAAADFARYTHGEAVALGMLVASGLSCKLGLLCDKDLIRVERIVHNSGLPLKIKQVSMRKMIEAYLRDKKFIGGRSRFVLLEGVAKPLIVQDIPIKMVVESIKERF